MEREESEKQETVSRREYEIDGKRFCMERHFIGEKEIRAVMKELAEERAQRETER